MKMNSRSILIPLCFLLIPQLSFANTPPNQTQNQDLEKFGNIYLLKYSFGPLVGQSLESESNGFSGTLSFDVSEGNKYNSYYLSGHGPFFKSQSSAAIRGGFMTGKVFGGLLGMSYMQVGGGFGFYQKCESYDYESGCKMGSPLPYPHVKALAGANFNIGIYGIGLETWAQYEIEEVSAGISFALNFGKLWR